MKHKLIEHNLISHKQRPVYEMALELWVELNQTVSMTECVAAVNRMWRVEK